MDREKCPCCGFPTLEELNYYEICELCDWEDDGQGDVDAHKVFGGPNGDYSLKEARKNFKENLIMYREATQKTNVIEAKKTLINVFLELDKYEVNALECQALWNKINAVEKKLELIRFTK